jgi:hypothetical protein
VKEGEPIGDPVDSGPWQVGTWVWHVRTKKGPWVVIEDTGGQLVYVDTKPDKPATKRRNFLDPHRHDVVLNHSDIEHYYRTVLTDKRPNPDPPWTSGVDWEKVGKGIGIGIGVVLLGLVGLFFFWLEAGAPM